MNNGLLKTLFAFVLIFGLADSSFAQEAKKKAENKEPEIKSEVKEIQGEVSYITKRSISVVFSRNKEKGSEEEIMLPFDRQIIIEHKRDISEINIGDIVNVKYLDETKDYGDKKENIIKAKVIRFINPAGRDSVYKKTVTAEAEEGLLPLKGAK